MKKRYIRPHIDTFSIRPSHLMSNSDEQQEVPKQGDYDDGMTIL